jgi:hypothetical protein
MIGTGSRDFASHFHDLSPQISGVGDHPSAAKENRRSSPHWWTAMTFTAL